MASGGSRSFRRWRLTAQGMGSLLPLMAVQPTLVTSIALVVASFIEVQDVPFVGPSTYNNIALLAIIQSTATFALKLPRDVLAVGAMAWAVAHSQGASLPPGDDRELLTTMLERIDASMRETMREKACCTDAEHSALLLGNSHQGARPPRRAQTGPQLLHDELPVAVTVPPDDDKTGRAGNHDCL